MDTITSNPTNPLISTSIPVFGDNVQDLLGTGTLQIHPSAIITVNSINDAVNSSPGVTTLRDAINKANADEGEDLIVFDRSLFSTAQTITLKSGELDITHNLDIIAPRDTLTGADLVTVSGNQASRVFEIETGATVTLSGLIVADGKATSDNGGGINNSGTLTVDSSIVRNNDSTRVFTGQSYVGGSGGGIYSTGTVKVSNSTISGNSAITGGGIYGSNVTVQKSTISGNSAGNAGGIFNTGTSTVNNSTISDNSITGGGGGIYNSSTLNVNNSTISGNSAAGGGGILNGGTLNVNNSTISGNSVIEYGGGIENGGTLNVNNSTISGNSASSSAVDGGGIFNFGTLKVNKSTISGNSATLDGGGIANISGGTSVVNNSTISGNSATDGGGGIYNSSTTLKVNNSTISGNSATDGGGIYNEYTANLTLLFSTVTQNQAANGGGVYQNDVPPSSTSVRGSNNVRNTIIAANLNSTNGVNPDVSGTFSSNGYNLIGNSTGSTGFGVTGDIVGTSAKPINPRLDSLKSNGGPTQTIALLSGSPAINAGDPILLSTDPTTDQRGFPRVSGGRADIGAFELS